MSMSIQILIVEDERPISDLIRLYLTDEGHILIASMGAKPYMWVEDVDDRELLTGLIRATYEELPEPKPKKPKASQKKKD